MASPQDAPAPGAPFSDLEALTPARAYPNPELEVMGGDRNSRGPNLAPGSLGTIALSQRFDYPSQREARLRCGFIAARPDWTQDLADLKIATNFGGGRMAADIVLRTLTDSGYRRHMESVRLRLAQEMERTAARLQALGMKPWLVPQAGMFLWCQLPGGMDATALARTCLEDGVVLAPGNAFSQSQSAGDFLRFNVAQCSDARIFEVLARALTG